MAENLLDSRALWVSRLGRGIVANRAVCAETN
jgi:hypothetical protein